MVYFSAILACAILACLTIFQGALVTGELVPPLIAESFTLLSLS